MNRSEHLLVTLAEECSEVTKEICKALRFGLDDRKTTDPTVINTDVAELTNAVKISLELIDLVALVEMCEESGLLPRMPVADQIARKKERVQRYMDYARMKGTLRE